MSATVRIPVKDPATTMLTYASIRLYRDTDPGGAFATLVTTIPLVAGVTLYTYADANGDANSVYQIDYYNSVGPVSSGRSESFYAGGTTLLRLRLQAAIDAGAGFGSTCSSAGTTTTLVDDTLADQGLDTAFLEGSDIYRPNAAAAGDKVRRVKKDGFNVAGSSLGIDRAWTNAPANGEVYHVFNFFPPIDRPGRAYSWDRVVRDGLQLVWFVDELNLGLGDGIKYTFDLAAWPDMDETVTRRVFLRSTDSNGVTWDVDQSLRGRFVTPRFDNLGYQVELMNRPSTSQSVIVEAIRRDFGLYVDTDVTLAPFESARKACVYACYRALNNLQPGKYAGELALAGANWERENRNTSPSDFIGGV